MSNYEKRFKRVKRIAIGLSLVLLVGTAAGLWFSPKLLTIESVVRDADAIVVLGGGTVSRSTLAAKLYQQQRVPSVIATGTGDCEENSRILQKGGVPQEAITTECNSTSTQENAEFSVPILRAQKAKRVLIVTHWYHSRRSLGTFRKAAPEIDFRIAVTKEGLDQRFTNPLMACDVLKEYAKILVYWVAYGVSPWQEGVPHGSTL